MLKEILRELNESDLLNQVGRILAEQPELFPETFYEMGRLFENQDEDQISDQLATSSLGGADDERAILDWIDETEEWQIYSIIDVENDVEIFEVHEGEWISENGLWSIHKSGVYRNIGEGSELVGEMEDLPDTVQRKYNELQGE